MQEAWQTSERGRSGRGRDFTRAGLDVGFGTDWIIMDPWDGLRHAMYWYRAATGDWNDMLAREALALHTIGGANILGLDVGILEPGKPADIILLDLEQPHFTPFYGNLAGILYHASRHDVRTTIVNGQVIMDQGRVLNVDQDEVVREVQRRVPRFRQWLATVDR